MSIGMGLACGFALAACSTLPNSGPTAKDILSQNGTSASSQYEVVSLDPAVVNVLRSQRPASFQAHFADYRPSVEPHIGVGDSVAVTIWEASSGGLFASLATPDRISTGANSVTIPDQVVGRDGSITVPYAGRVHVAGETTRAVQATIEHALQGKAIQPQALVNVTRAVSTSVTITGEVTTGARIPLSVRGDRIMDVIAEAGGIRAPVNETYVQLSRGSTTVRVPLERVASDSRENIYLRPNDVLTLIRDPQTFIAYGATGRNGEIPFDAEGIDLAQALAKAGGLLDYRSDASGVFLFRYEPQSVVRMLNPESPLLTSGAPMLPVVYRLDMHDPSSLFAAQTFQLHNRDLIYVSNAPVTDLQKVFGIVSGAMSPGVSAASVCISAGC